MGPEGPYGGQSTEGKRALGTRSDRTGPVNVRTPKDGAGARSIVVGTQGPPRLQG